MIGMESEPVLIDETPPSPFKARIEALQIRVNKAALALHERNVRPTVQRIRTALGGGSPNDLAPALKQWREAVLPTLETADETPAGVPPLIADIVRELWTRASAAAAVEAVGGAKARRAIAQTEEAAGLRAEIVRLRDQLEREQQLVGELRAARSRAEAILRDALERLAAAEKRGRRSQLRIGELMARPPIANPQTMEAPRTRRRPFAARAGGALGAAVESRRTMAPTKVKAGKPRRVSRKSSRPNGAKRNTRAKKARR